MDSIEQEIRECYQRHGVKLSWPTIFSNGKKFEANSQYGYCLVDKEFNTPEEAEAYVISYYRERMNLIRQ